MRVCMCVKRGRVPACRMAAAVVECRVKFRIRSTIAYSPAGEEACGTATPIVTQIANR